MSKSTPILFSAPMIRALLAGTKTQTRRLVKPQPVPAWSNWCWPSSDPVECLAEWGDEISSPECMAQHCRHGQPGDHLCVKEAAWMWCEKRPNGTTKTGRAKWHYVPLQAAPVIYCADQPARPQTCVVSPDTGNGNAWGWRKKIGRFLPKWASRITLEITSVRVERLHDITKDDAVSEGIERTSCGDHEAWKNYEFETANPRKGVTLTDQQHRITGYESPCASYKSLWQSLNGPGSWDLNPFVWVVQFRRVTP